MLEKYLKEKGITPQDIYTRLPDIEETLRNYLSIKGMDAGAEYEDELNKLSSEIVNYLKNNEKVFQKDEIQPKTAEVVDKKEQVFVSEPIAPKTEEVVEVAEGYREPQAESIQAEQPSAPKEVIEQITIPDFGAEITIPDFGEEPIAVAVSEHQEQKAKVHTDEIQIPDMEDVPAEKVVEAFDNSSGYAVRGAEVTPNIWMKILALSGVDYRKSVV